MRAARAGANLAGKALGQALGGSARKR
jgi:hypothetical protein